MANDLICFILILITVCVSSHPVVVPNEDYYNNFYGGQNYYNNGPIPYGDSYNNGPFNGLDDHYGPINNIGDNQGLLGNLNHFGGIRNHFGIGGGHFGNGRGLFGIGRRHFGIGGGHFGHLGGLGGGMGHFNPFDVVHDTLQLGGHVIDSGVNGIRDVGHRLVGGVHNVFDRVRH